MKKILVPTDFSEHAENALHFAAEIAKKSEDSKIILLHVVEHPHGDSFHVTGEVNLPGDNMDNLFLLKLIQKSKGQLEAEASQDYLSGLDIATKLVVGRPYDSITEAISDHDADLTVMGTAGSSGVSEVFLGSNTEKIVRTANCPVISIKSKVDAVDIKSISFATDLNMDQYNLCKKLKNLQELFNATLHLVYINTRNTFMSNRDAREGLEKFARDINLVNYHIDIYNHENVEDGVLYFAEDNDIDMIAMGTHGRTGLLHLLTGSLAEDVVNHAKRPVWTARI
ncbi:MAG: universal stress protein [Bacteroidota bacterium]